MEQFIVPIKPMDKMSFSKMGEVNPTQQKSETTSFQGILDNFLNEINESNQKATNDTYNLALGNTNNLAQVQINGMKATAMLQTAVQLTTRTVNAYKEIMSMQI